MSMTDRILSVRDTIESALIDLGCEDVETGFQMIEPYGELFFSITEEGGTRRNYGLQIRELDTTK